MIAALEKGSPYYRQAAMLAIGLFVGGYISKERTYDMLAEQINTLQVLRTTLEVHASGRFERSAQFRAKIEYPSVFKKNLRRVKLSGEAVFDVEHDERCPFVVETFASDIRVGTKFNVVADERHQRFSTHCSKVGCKLQTGSIHAKRHYTET
ncbi:MAG: FecR domain-containing protein [Alistipes onderdonkii]